MTRTQRGIAAVLAVVVLGVLLALQLLSARHATPESSSGGVWQHDLSLYAGLILLCVIAVSPAARRTAVARRVAEPTAAAGAVEQLQDGLIVAGRAAAVVFLAFLISFPAVILAAGERGELPVIVAIALALAALVIRGAAWPLAGASLVIVACVAWSLLRFDSVDQSARALVVRPTNPIDLFPDWDPSGLEGRNIAPRDFAQLDAGRAPVLVDLRTLDVSGVLNIEARSALDRVVVALPRDRCWNVNVQFERLDRRLPAAYVQTAPLLGIHLEHDNAQQFPVESTGQADNRSVIGEPTGLAPPPVDLGDPDRNVLVAFGEGIDGRDGRWTRVVDEAHTRNAATLNLWAWPGTQVIVRDYPGDVPLDIVQRASSKWQDRNNERELLQWPDPIDRPAAERAISGGRLPGPATTAAAAREQARRLAGACAAPEEQARRWVRIEPSEVRVVEAGEFATYVNGVGEQRRVRMAR